MNKVSLRAQTPVVMKIIKVPSRLLLFSLNITRQKKNTRKINEETIYFGRSKYL